MVGRENVTGSAWKERVAEWNQEWVDIINIRFKDNTVEDTGLVVPKAAPAASAGEPDGVPLETFSPAAAQTAPSLFAIRALSQLMIALLCVIVLVRYRGLVPLMLGVLLTEHLARRAIFRFLPIPRSEVPPGVAVNQMLLAILVVALVVALWPRPDPAAAPVSS